MNKERILQLADYIEQLPPYQFSMRDFMCEDECGTIACLAGWATKLWPEFIKHYSEYNGRIDYVASGADALRIDYDDADRLFIPVTPKNPNDPTNPYAGDQRKRAAQVLRHLAETGRVDWKLKG